MKIGELARLTRTPVDTIRYYEREGLLPTVPRSDGNYRVYGEAEAERLAFIRHCRSLDMSLDEVRTLLRFRDAPHEDCGDVNTLLDEHIGHVAARIRELRALEQALHALRERCAAPTEPGRCGILAGLAEAAVAEPAAATHTGGTHAHPAGAAGPRRTR